MVKVSIGIVIAIVVISLGFLLLTYFEIGKFDPKELLNNYKNKFDNINNIRLTYTFKMSMMSSILPYLSPEIQVDFYKLNNDTKTIMSFMGMTTAIYTKDGTRISCTESSLYTTTKGSITCTQQESYQEVFNPNLNESLINQTNVTYSGLKEMIGRVCDDFIITLDETQLKYLQGQMPITGLASAVESEITKPENKTYILYEVCMDKQYGYPALFNTSMSSYSVLSGKTTETNLFSIEVTQMSTDVKESDMVLPVSFVINRLNCKNNSVNFNITSFNDITSPTINVDLSSYTKNISLSTSMSDLEADRTYSIDIPSTTPIGTGYYSTKVCINGDCQDTSCYISSYLPYP